MRALVLLSGGMDSAVLLYQLVRDCGAENVAAISLNYGQRHARELEAARTLAGLCGVPHDTYDLSSLRPLFAKGSQTGDADVPEGHYAEENMKLTVVPNRNMVLLSLACAAAITRDFDTVAYAAHAGDHAIYPDCRPVFIDAMREAFALCDWKHVDLHAPFSHIDKGAIARAGVALGVPFEHTWTCYKGGDAPCGKCGSCVERAEAFASAGVPDPLLVG